MIPPFMQEVLARKSGFASRFHAELIACGVLTVGVRNGTEN